MMIIITNFFSLFRYRIDLICSNLENKLKFESQFNGAELTPPAGYQLMPSESSLVLQSWITVNL